jgi:purine-cytosine permease-like protein
MKSSFSITVNLTTSKIAAFIILFLGSIYSFQNNDATTLLATFSATSAILIMKTYQVRRSYQNYNNTQTTECDEIEEENKNEIG